MTRGFSLIELMISLALFGLIASGAMSLVMSGARSQARSARIDTVQSGVRAGLDFITRDVLSASAGARSTNLTMGNGGSAITIISVTDSSSGPDTLDVYSIDATKMATLTADLTGGSTTSLSVDSAGAFAANDWVQICDLSVGTIVQLQGASGTTLTLPSAPTLPSGTTAFTKLNGWVFKSRHSTYAINSSLYGNTTSGSGSALTLDLNDGNGPQPLAEGVEDLQVALAIDQNGDGVIGTENAGTAGADEWIYNVAGEIAPASLANLKAVRVTLVGKSTVADRGTFPKRPAAEDRPAGSADGFFRRVVKSEIAVRNLNL
jgi:prepilin-type N-terminal cleavage/methylation domain-containing protein